MKLLAKRAEDRYQTTAGLEHDLRRCWAEWQAAHRIADFPLGENDAPDRLLIPEKLYGREPEVEILLAAFDRVVKNGATELILVSGYSGIGKSSVVNELQPVLVPRRGILGGRQPEEVQRGQLGHLFPCNLATTGGYGAGQAIAINCRRAAMARG